MAAFDAMPAAATARAEAMVAAQVSEAGLRYVSDSEPGLRRRRRSGAFCYVNAQGRAVRDAETLARIRKLAIPPAYEDVWICAQPQGHLQATGRDARGRKQYRYHARWRQVRDEAKFSRMVAFGQALPRLRRRLRQDLALPGLPREKVLATLVAILDLTRVRIGNAEYARDNDSYGLATLRNRHVRFIGRGRALLSFRGKGGQPHELELDDARVTRIVRRCQQLPGQHLFQYLDESGERRAVDSGQVNDYLREVMGDAFTAKDFRTWGATLRAIALMSCTPLPQRRSERALKACINQVVVKVAADLRNTPAVCRKSYINPLVFEAWRAGQLPQAARVGERGFQRKDHVEARDDGQKQAAPGAEPIAAEHRTIAQHQQRISGQRDQPGRRVGMPGEDRRREKCRGHAERRAGEPQRRIAQFRVSGAHDHAADVGQMRIGTQAPDAMGEAEEDRPGLLHRSTQRAIVDQRVADDF